MILDILSWITIIILGGLSIVALVYDVINHITSGDFWESAIGQFLIVILFAATAFWLIFCIVNLFG